MLFIYTILLINNTYLILSSEERISHIHNTPNYKDIIEITQTKDKSDFDKIVKKYVDEFGNDKVKTSIIINITEDDKKLIEYIDNITDVEVIENEIKKLTMIKQKLIQLENMIKHTSNTQVNEYGLGKFMSDYAKYKRLEKLREIHQNPPHQTRRNNNNIVNDEMTELSNYFQNNIININGHQNSKYQIILGFIMDISDKYHQYIEYEISKNNLPSSFIRDTDVIVQLYSTMYFNKKMKSHLENFIKKNGSQEQITSKIIYAYSKII